MSLLEKQLSGCANCSAEEVDEAMRCVQKGSMLSRVKFGRVLNKPRFVRLSDDQTQIIYENHKAQIACGFKRFKTIDVAELIEVRKGWNTDSFNRAARRPKFASNFKESCCLSVLFRRPQHLFHKSIDLIAESPAVAYAWIVALRQIVAQRRAEVANFNELEWLERSFKAADANSNGLLSFGELWELLINLNIEIEPKFAKKIFNHIYANSAHRVTGSSREKALNSEEFIAFFKALTARPDLELIMKRYSIATKPVFMPESLKDFLETEKQMRSISLEECRSLIERFEPESHNSSEYMLTDVGFRQMMMSRMFHILDEKKLSQKQDMSLPLNNYFISSSHNTYLTGGQLRGDASVEGYISALKNGARLIEIDVWDGPCGEPNVTHGRTLVNAISLRAVVTAVATYGFQTSPYPIIISLENHASLMQQQRMVEIFRNGFGSMLLHSFSPNLDALPSPEELKGKILIKGARLSDSVSVVSSAKHSKPFPYGQLARRDVAKSSGNVNSLNDVSSNGKPRRKTTGYQSGTTPLPLAAAVAIANQLGSQQAAAETVEWTAEAAVVKRPADGFATAMTASCSELQMAGEIGLLAPDSDDGLDSDEELAEDATDSAVITTITATAIDTRSASLTSVKVSKKTKKLVHPNLSALTALKSCGLKHISLEEAITHHPFDGYMSVSESKFEEISRDKAKLALFVKYASKHLVKLYPAGIRADSSNMNPIPGWRAGIQTIAMNMQTGSEEMDVHNACFLQNANCGYLLKPECLRNGQILNESADCLRSRKVLYVKVISGQYIPKPSSSPNSNDIVDPFVKIQVVGLECDNAEAQTKVIPNNGFNPVWNEDFVFHLKAPEFAVIRFCVKDQDISGSTFIGQFSAPINCLSEGYSHLELQTGRMDSSATLFLWMQSRTIQVTQSESRMLREVAKKRPGLATTMMQQLNAVSSVL